MANKQVRMHIDTSDFERRIGVLMKRAPEAMNWALEIAGIQFLTWSNQGSPQEPAKPPIRFGVLRGSSSVFVADKLIAVQEQSIKNGSTESPTPNRSYSGKKFTITWGWNTPYATKMHEWDGNWGKFTLQDGDAGSKWAEKHVKSDRDAVIKMIAIDFKKKAGL